MKLFSSFSLFLLLIVHELSSEPLLWDIYRNAAFHHADQTPTSMMRDWIFSQKSAAIRTSNNHNESTKPTSVSLPLYGSVHSTAYWFADVHIGTPHMQLESLIVDTGSSVMGFPCTGCKDRCGEHIDLPYNYSASESLKPIECDSMCPLCAAKSKSQFRNDSLDSLVPANGQCAYHIRYTEGSSLSGIWEEDIVVLSENAFDFAEDDLNNDVLMVSVPFGCHSEETHLFISQEASGILGLEATSRFGPPPFVTAVLANLLNLQRVKGGSLRDTGLTGTPSITPETEPVFAMCISQQGGVLTIGTSNSKYHMTQEPGIAATDTFPSATPDLWETLRNRSRHNQSVPPESSIAAIQIPSWPAQVQAQQRPTHPATTEEAPIGFVQHSVTAVPELPYQIGFGTGDSQRSSISADHSSTVFPYGSLMVQYSPSEYKPVTLSAQAGLRQPELFQWGVISAQEANSNGIPKNRDFPISSSQLGSQQQNQYYSQPNYYQRPVLQSNVEPFISSERHPRSTTAQLSPNRPSLNLPRLDSTHLTNSIPAGIIYLLQQPWGRWESGRSLVETEIAGIHDSYIKPDFGVVEFDQKILNNNISDSDNASRTVDDNNGENAIELEDITKLGSIWSEESTITQEQQASAEYDNFEGRLRSSKRQTAPLKGSTKPLPPAPPQVYYQTIKGGQRWTPLVLDPDEEGGWPGSYVAILQGWKVKGAAMKENVLTVPINSQPLKTRTAEAFGLPALVDSGTTLTYLPFLLYANLWTSLLQNVAAAKKQRRKLSESNQFDSVTQNEGIIRVSGTSLNRMKEKLEMYIARLKVQTSESPRQMKARKRSRNDSMKRSSRSIEKSTNNGPVESSLQRELRTAESLKFELDELELNTLQSPSDTNTGKAINEITSALKTGSATPRKLKAIDHSSSPFPDMHPSTFRTSSNRTGHYSSTVPLRSLVPVEVPNLDEECWFLSNGEADLRYFPDMLLQFANHVEHVWRPTSYLYRKGKTKVYCMTIVSEDTSLTDGDVHHEIASTGRTLDENNLYDTMASTGLKRRQLLPETKQAVLGSTFFINQDLVFHLGRWEVGFWESGCPSTDLGSRVSRRH